MKTKIILIVSAIILVFGLITFAAGFNSIAKHEYAFTFDRFSGEIKPVNRTGWLLVNPFKYGVNTIDLRPYQIRISANLDVGERVLNAKLVRFNPNGLNQFIANHGRDAGDNLTNLKEIFKCYAFAPDGGKNCPFIIIEEETGKTSFNQQTNEK